MPPSWQPDSPAARWIRPVATILAAVVGCGVLAVVAFLALASWLVANVVPPATRPCEQAFAQSLVDDPLLAEPGPGDEGPGEFGDTGCQDADGGGVSYAEQTRVTSADPDDVVAAFAAAARRLGWDFVRVSPGDRRSDGSVGPTVCAERIRDGHTVEFDLRFWAAGTSTEPGTTEYLVSLTGDAGDFPRCARGSR